MKEECAAHLQSRATVTPHPPQVMNRHPDRLRIDSEHHERNIRIAAPHMNTFALCTSEERSPLARGVHQSSLCQALHQQLLLPLQNRVGVAVKLKLHSGDVI